MVLALWLAATFAVDLRWFPAVGYVGLGRPWEWLKHLVLPGLSLSALTMGELARQLRGSMLEELDSDYVLALRARGVGNRSIVLKHGLKNAAVPAITVLGVRLAQLLGATVIVEQIFLVDGLGRTTVRAVIYRDIPVVLGVVVVSTLLVLILNLVVDASYAYFNPKLKRA
jgi:peptide/nickel transport system permease protein